MKIAVWIVVALAWLVAAAGVYRDLMPTQPPPQTCADGLPQLITYAPAPDGDDGFILSCKPGRFGPRIPKVRS